MAPSHQPDSSTGDVPRSGRSLKLFLAWVVVGMLAASVGILVSRFGAATAVKTQPKDHPGIIQELRTGSLFVFHHFPKQIPPNAASVTMSYQPKVMQGAAQLTLRYKLPPAAIQGVINEWSAKAIPSAGQPTYLSNRPLPPTFMVYLLLANDGNHGENARVAVETTTNEVCYWAEDF